MRRDRTMILTVFLLALCKLAHGSGAHFSASAVPVAVAGPPVVTATSSQYFERTFNRLVVAPLEPVIPVAPVAPVAPAPPVFVQPVPKTVPVVPTQNVPVETNVAIAIATAHAAAPVATILLPPYPFAPPHTFGFLPPIVVPDEPKNTTTVQTTVKEPEATTPLPLPSNTDNSFAQAPQTDQGSNFNNQVIYGPPRVPPPPVKPQKLKTSVELEPVPLTYIAPPPLPLHDHHHHHHHHHKPLKYVHYYRPINSKLILRPIMHEKVRIVKVVPAKLVAHHKVLVAPRNVARNQKVISSRAGNVRDTEPTTFKPFNRPITKPPRV